MENEIKCSRYPLNLQLFAEGDADPDPNPAPDPTPDKTFTQAELDRIVADRLARDRKGREDYDDIKTKLTTLEKAEEDRAKAEMTATERLEAEKADALKRAQEAEERNTSVLTAANKRLINAEFKTAARDANIPADRLAAALKLADTDAVTVDDDGNVNGLADVITTLIAEHPYLAEAAQPKTVGSPSGGGDPAIKTKDQRLAEAKAMAEKNPTPQAIAAYTKIKRELSS
ncbi:scaffolding protein [Paenibacillus sp. FSL R5-0636]|uniref:phage scaffolding protein n=1 Tax=Paenibacillus TaxID=44249 RepID=UPI00096DDDFE|nr:hypothetical protein [Paenibacillus odorifer]OMC96214.1 hypothetical protein BJP49_10950 [Paenibacillus odorifer]